MSNDIIRIDQLPVPCIIGVLPAERETSQPLTVSVSWYLDLTVAGNSGLLTESVDYSVASQALALVLTAGRFRLLETAALAICSFLLVPPAVQAVEITLTKPKALGGRGIPSVVVKRDRAEMALPTRQVTTAGLTETLWPGPDAVVERFVPDRRVAVAEAAQFVPDRRAPTDEAPPESTRLSAPLVTTNTIGLGDGSWLRVRNLQRGTGR